MVEDAAAGRRQGWAEFVRDYSWMTEQLLAHYFPTLRPEMATHVAAVFARARANDNAWLKGLKFSNERELLMDYRELVLNYGREMARVPTPHVTMEQYVSVIEDLTLIERELLWMYVKGYDAGQIAPIMMNAAATAEAVKKLADERLAKVLPGATKDAFRLSTRELLESAEKARTEQCLGLKTFNNLVNGQISWRERELAEQHIRNCVHCVDRFTSFQEMIRYRKDVEPRPEEEVETILASLDLPAPKPKGLLAKIFG